MATVALESTGGRQSEERAEENRERHNRESALGHTARRRAHLLQRREKTRRAKRAHEALPHTPPGGKPNGHAP